MKLHSIKIENIASLRGNHFIDFDKLSEINNSIFAITGDTGAGKSTILNCISLSLYGQTYKKSLNQFDYITLGEQTGSVELKYTQNQKQYLALWECRVRKKNGEFLKAPKSNRSHYLLEDEIKTAIEQAPDEVLGLDFDQFCQTIILNQGEFARFLTSSFSERKVILEKLYKADKLKLLNPTLRLKMNSLVQKLDIINSKLETFSSQVEQIDPKQLQETKKILSELKSKLNAIHKTKSLAVDLTKLAQNFSDNSSRIELENKIINKALNLKNDLQIEAKNIQESLDLKKEESKEKLPKLYKAREKALQLKTTQTKLEQERNQYEKHQSQIKHDQEQINVIEKQLLDCNKVIKGFVSKFSLPKEKVFQKEKVNKLLDRSHFLINHFALSSQKKDQVQKDLIEIKQKFDNTKSSIQKVTKENITNNISDLKKEKERFEKKVQEEQSLTSQLEQFIEFKNIHDQEVFETTNKIKSYTHQAEETNILIKDLETEISNCDDALSYNKLIEYKSILIKKSIQDNVCFVCENEDVKHLATANKDRDALERIESLNNKLSTLNESLSSYKSKQIILKEKLSSEKQVLIKLESKIKEKLSKIAINSIDLKTDLKKELKRLQEKSERTINERKRTDELILKILTDQSKIDQLKADSLDLEKKLADKELSLKTINDEYQALIDQANQFIFNFNEYTQLKILKVTESTSILQTLLQVIDKNKELLYISSNLEQSKKNIKDKQEALHISKKNLDDLETLYSNLTDELEVLTAGLNPEELIKEIEDNLKRLDLNNNNIKQKLKEAEVDYSASKAKINTYKDQATSIEASFISSHKELMDIIKSSYLKDIALYHSLENSFIVEHISGELFLSITKDLEGKEKETKEKIELFTKEITEKELLIKKAQEAQLKTQELSLEKKKLTTQKEDWEKLYTLLGRDEFRNFVLSYVEKMLIIQTNAELEHLYDGRYILKQFVKESKTSPEFYIIDKLLGGSTRKISTLSGGETFMVSLAMAFALAELTRGESQIDSFFIDEGFGTLDEDSIDDVLDTLQEIETRGKQVGIISHVKSMTSRIPVNINLSKNTSGSSEISIQYN